MLCATFKVECLMSRWTILHLYSDENGISAVDFDYTEDIPMVEFAPPAPNMYASRVSDAEALTFVELPVGWYGGWHPSPKAQWIICLAGTMGYEAGNGTRFTIKSGSCIFTTDVFGKGHNSWNAGNEPVRLALVQIK
jgi:quercetin dioxygenase-like cupin family protein